MAAQQGLASGQTQLPDTERSENFGYEGYFVKSEQLAARHEPVIIPKNLLRHAVGTAKITAIRYRYPQIPYRPVQ
ncbi:hypothetical protein GCM10010913_44350 [Paenibacillus aceti]|uniref:Uncharacterized protein n=1 Tax=Paenibacillus aceti TaxID=1820010 RepID=A0ABQ1W825_9BACL|nr:hypothetical protein GCM10010913_44350 [Paenibacillus aceti]